MWTASQRYAMEGAEVEVPRTERQSFIRQPLTWILGNNANVIVLRELCLHGEDMSRPQLAERTGLSASSVRDALEMLVDARIVRATGFQKSRLYRLQRAHHLFPAIELLFRTEGARYALIRQAVTSVARSTAGVQAAWVYGSVARSDDQPASDLDLAILADEPVAAVAEKFRSALAEHAARLDFRPSIVSLTNDDVARLDRAADPFWLNLLRDGSALYGPHPELAGKRKSAVPA